MNTSHIANSHLGSHGSECYNVFAILVNHPLQYLLAAILIKVDIDIGHRNTLGVKETLKQQVVLYWVDIGDAQTVGNSRTSSRTPARANRNAHLAGGSQKIPNN